MSSMLVYSAVKHHKSKYQSLIIKSQLYLFKPVSIGTKKKTRAEYTVPSNNFGIRVAYGLYILSFNGW
jgi:hypothetical protein